MRRLPGGRATPKVKVFLDPDPAGDHVPGKAQSKMFLSDLP